MTKVFTLDQRVAQVWSEAYPAWLNLEHMRGTAGYEYRTRRDQAFRAGVEAGLLAGERGSATEGSEPWHGVPVAERLRRLAATHEAELSDIAIAGAKECEAMYQYSAERDKVFTEEGQVLFLKIRDRARELMDAAGAARLDKMIQGCTGDSWEMVACVDRLVELGEIREVTADGAVAGQRRVFVRCDERRVTWTGH